MKTHLLYKLLYDILYGDDTQRPALWDLREICPLRRSARCFLHSKSGTSQNYPPLVLMSSQHPHIEGYPCVVSLPTGSDYTSRCASPQQELPCCHELLGILDEMKCYVKGCARSSTSQVKRCQAQCLVDGHEALAAPVPPHLKLL